MLAILAGFIGMLLVVDPGGVVGWAVLIPVAAAVVGGLRDVATRALTRGENSESILFWSAMVVVVSGLAAAPWLGWETVTAQGWGLLVVNGLLNGSAHFMIIEAFRHGEASVIAPFKYSGLLWGIALGFLIWGYVPTVMMLAGGLLIVAAGVSLARN